MQPLLLQNFLEAVVNIFKLVGRDLQARWGSLRDDVSVVFIRLEHHEIAVDCHVFVNFFYRDAKQKMFNAFLLANSIVKSLGRSLYRLLERREIVGIISRMMNFGKQAETLG